MKIDVAFADFQVETFWSFLDWETERDEMSAIHGDPVYFQFNGIDTEGYKPRKGIFNKTLLEAVKELGYPYSIDRIEIPVKDSPFMFFGDGSRKKKGLRIFYRSGDYETLYSDKELFDLVVSELKGKTYFASEWKKPENRIYDILFEVLQIFRETYGLLYDGKYEGALRYSDAVDIFDRTAEENADFIGEFIRLRGDFISSDREAAAFIYAVRKECEKFPWLKEIVRCE